MIDAAQALQRLITGNRRFVEEVRAAQKSATGERRRRELAESQEPFAIVLGCSDSRVPAEIVFDQGLGRNGYHLDLAMSDGDCSLVYLMGEQIIAGSPGEVRRRLLGLIEGTGLFGTLVLMSYDWDDKKSWLSSMELFARELMPALNKAVCETA